MSEKRTLDLSELPSDVRDDLKHYDDPEHRAGREVRQDVVKVITDQLGVRPEDVKDDSSFVDDLGADSLDTVELVMGFEERFNIEIPDEDAETITTVGSAIYYIKSHLRQ